MSTNEAVRPTDDLMEGESDGLAQWIPEWFPESRVQEANGSSSDSRPTTIYAVVIHDDEVHACRDFVEVLEQVFGYSEPAAYSLTQEIAKSGRAVVWKGFRDDAERKAHQARNYQPRWRLGGSITAPQRDVEIVPACTITVELAKNAVQSPVAS